MSTISVKVLTTSQLLMNEYVYLKALGDKVTFQ